MVALGVVMTIFCAYAGFEQLLRGNPITAPFFGIGIISGSLTYVLWEIVKIKGDNA